MNVNDWHILARPILAGFTGLLVAVVLVVNPDIAIEKLGLIPAAALGYITLKWTGKQAETKA